MFTLLNAITVGKNIVENNKAKSQKKDKGWSAETLWEKFFTLTMKVRSQNEPLHKLGETLSCLACERRP